MARQRRENRGYRLFKTTYRDRQGTIRQAAKWYIEFRDHNETVRRMPAFTSKPASDELGRNIVKLIAFHRASGGQTDPGLCTWLIELPLRVSQKLVEIGVYPSGKSGGQSASFRSCRRLSCQDDR